jgi:RNA polymerase sigma factor (sigma-70 family)
MEHVVNEIELLRRSAAGDKEAFGLLVERHQTLVYAVAYSATGNMDKTEELAQETFLRAWGNLRQLRDPGRFRGWLCTIVRNLANRAGKNRSHDMLAGAGSLEDMGIPAREPGPPEELLRRERQEMVWSALRRIPLKYREPMVLFYSTGRSVREVADELELSEHVVRQRLYRGRQLLNGEVASLAEDTLTGVRPGRAFAGTVVALLPTAAVPATGAAIVGAKSAPAATTLSWSIIGGLAVLLGPILGLLGGLLGFITGARAGIRYTRSPRLRRFIIGMIILVAFLGAALLIVPSVLAIVGIIPWWAVWVCLFVYWALSLLQVSLMFAYVWRHRMEESTYWMHSPPPSPPQRTSAAGFCAISAGGIFVAVAWPLLLAGVAHDWAAFALILTCAILTVLVTVYLVYGHGWRTVAVWLALAAVTGLLFVVVNLRWDIWIRAGLQRAHYLPVYDIPLQVLNVTMIVVAVGVALALWIVSRRRRTNDRRHDRDS